MNSYVYEERNKLMNQLREALALYFATLRTNTTACVALK